MNGSTYIAVPKELALLLKPRNHPYLLTQCLFLHNGMIGQEMILRPLARLLTLESASKLVARIAFNLDTLAEHIICLRTRGILLPYTVDCNDIGQGEGSTESITTFKGLGNLKLKSVLSLYMYKLNDLCKCFKCTCQPSQQPCYSSRSDPRQGPLQRRHISIQ